MSMDVAAIIARQERIGREPIRMPNPDKMQAILADFQARTQRSAAQCERAQRLLPRGSEHTLPIKLPYPLFMSHGRGSRVWDLDGNEYLDTILSGGAIVLGHNHPELNREMVELIGSRTNFHGFYDELELAAAERIVAHFPSVERVRFTASGSEANLAALRIARSYTGRRKIIKYRGGYHGWGDPVMDDLEVPGSGRIIAHGIPEELLDLTVLVSQGDLEGLEVALAGGDVAAVICEPMGAESGLVPVREGFHRQAMEIAHRHGTLYIFDEVVTGLRVGLGGAQALQGVSPDLTTLGKGLMNGYPSCGAVCGRAEIMETASTGLPDERAFAYIAGTLSGNTLSVAAAYHTIRLLEQPGVMDHLQAVAADYVAKLNVMFERRGTSFFAYNIGGIIRIELTAPHAVPLTSPEAIGEVLQRRGVLAHYALAVHNQGVLSRMGRDMVCTAHSVEDNDKAVAAYEAMIDMLE
jgi:glutamate-1-semialdehyde 2,1-aminomutase